jgi:hypothetical protein
MAGKPCYILCSRRATNDRNWSRDLERPSVCAAPVQRQGQAAVVAGFRWPSAYAFLLPTKVTPGIALLWFVVRREWRNLAIALATTAAIVAVSFVIAPNLWFDWATVLRNDSTYGEPAFPR